MKIFFSHKILTGEIVLESLLSVFPVHPAFRKNMKLTNKTLFLKNDSHWDWGEKYRGLTLNPHEVFLYVRFKNMNLFLL